MTHKILSFTFKDEQKRVRSYWKLNSSILSDKAYIAIVRQTMVNVDQLNILDKYIYVYYLFIIYLLFIYYLFIYLLHYITFKVGNNTEVNTT